MGGIRELRGRIKSVGNIRQITRAMEMVASTKLRRFQDRALSSRPYTQEITGLVSHLASVLGESLADRPLFKPGAGNAIAVVLVSSDRGLCGPYNSNLFKALEHWLREPPREDGTGLTVGGQGADVRYFVFGKKGYQYLNARKRRIERLFVDPPLEEIDYRGAARAAQDLVQVFLSGEYRSVRVLSTAFESMVRTVPRWFELLPILAASLAGGEKQDAEKRSGDPLLEPDALTLFERLIPRYLETRMYNALIEAITSEYASRRVSMKNATDAAKEMQGALKLVYNRKRQESITKELLDIVGGVEALR